MSLAKIFINFASRTITSQSKYYQISVNVQDSALFIFKSYDVTIIHGCQSCKSLLETRYMLVQGISSYQQRFALTTPQLEPTISEHVLSSCMGP